MWTKIVTRFCTLNFSYFNNKQPVQLLSNVMIYTSHKFSGFFFAICVLQTSEEGAQTTIYCAVQEGIEEHSGKYFEDCHVARPGSNSQDDVAAKKLWELSEQLVNSVLQAWMGP